MTAAFNTQESIEVLIEPSPVVRTTQVAVEVLIAPPNPAARLTQASVEILIQQITINPCAQPWTMPVPNQYPVPENGGPVYVYFDELEGDWNEYGQTFADGTPRFDSLQTNPVRRFVFEYAGLDPDAAAILDNHHYSTRGALAFILRHPRTGEILNNVRYERYTRSNHQKLWSQERKVELVRYPL